jgi:hypothetical protein
MNLFDLGGQLLRVGKAVTPPEGLLSNTQLSVLLTNPNGTNLTLQEIEKSNLVNFNLYRIYFFFFIKKYALFFFYLFLFNIEIIK